MRTVIFSAALLILHLTPTPLAAQDVDLGPDLEIIGELRLEETQEALVADPRMIPDPLGGWIYWDAQGQDVRRYSASGQLLSAFGQAGEGPGEFSGLMGVVRVGDGRLAAIDRGGRVSVWTAEGNSLLSDFVSGVVLPHGIAAAGNERIVILSSPAVAGEGGSAKPVVQVLNLDSRELSERAFDAPLGESHLSAGRSILSPSPMVYEGSAYFALAPFDSLWAVSLGESGRTGRVRIESTALNSTPVPPGPGAPRSDALAWVTGASFPGRFFRMPREGWIMGLWGVRPGGGRFRGIVRFDDEGRRLWEIETKLDLIAADPVSGDILLWDPEGIEPSRVLVARETLRR